MISEGSRTQEGGPRLPLGLKLQVRDNVHIIIDINGRPTENASHVSDATNTLDGSDLAKSHHIAEFNRTTVSCTATHFYNTSNEASHKFSLTIKRQIEVPRSLPCFQEKQNNKLEKGDLPEVFPSGVLNRVRTGGPFKLPKPP